MPTTVVTGASSFIGFHIVRHFARSGHKVIATHTKPISEYTGLSAIRLHRLKKIASLVKLDIQDADRMSSLIKTTRPDYWVHHAGYANPGSNPDYDFQRSIEINVNPLLGLYPQLNKTKAAILITGTAEEYGPKNTGISEDDVCLPNTPYGLSKLTETLTARQLALRHQVPTRVIRVLNPIGPLDSAKKIIPIVMDKLHLSEPIDLSPCLQARDFLSVYDLCEGYRLLTKDFSRVIFDTFNLCSGRPIRLRDVLLRVASLLKADKHLLRFNAIKARPFEPQILYGSNRKASRFLGWRWKPPLEAIPSLIPPSLHGHPCQHSHQNAKGLSRNKNHLDTCDTLPSQYCP